MTAGLGLASLLAASLLPVGANAKLIKPDAGGVATNIPTGTNDSTDPFTDDVLLESLTFGDVTLIASSNQIEAVQSAFVVSGRSATNAEFGDNDDGSDGNPNPFARVGIDVLNPNGTVNTGVQESTDPAIQDLALASVFSSLSLSEITDGEGGGSVTNFIFSFGITDNSSSGTVGGDTLPEIVLFERGNNDSTTVRAITGGTYDAPTFAPTSVAIASGDMSNTGISIDTTEISGSQELAAIGIDLNDFGINNTSTIVYGIQIETDGGDFGGFFQAAEDPGSQFSEVPEGLKNPAATVPEPAGFTLAAGLVAVLYCSIRRQNSL